MIDAAGRVLGMMVGRPRNDPERGFVLTSDVLRSQLGRVGNPAPSVNTGRCLGE